MWSRCDGFGRGCVENVLEKVDGEGLRVDEWKDDQRGDDGEIDGAGEEHPFRGLIGEDVAGVEGGIFEHGGPRLTS